MASMRAVLQRSPALHPHQIRNVHDRPRQAMAILASADLIHSADTVEAAVRRVALRDQRTPA
jgi:hypothetical protein